MNQHYRDTRKIDPKAGATIGDGTLNDEDRIEIGPTQLAFDEWDAAGLTLPNLPAMREHGSGARGPRGPRPTAGPPARRGQRPLCGP